MCYDYEALYMEYARERKQKYEKIVHLFCANARARAELSDKIIVTHTTHASRTYVGIYVVYYSQILQYTETLHNTFAHCASSPSTNRTICDTIADSAPSASRNSGHERPGREYYGSLDIHTALPHRRNGNMLSMISVP